VEDYSTEELQRIGKQLYALGCGDLRDLLKQDGAKEIGRYNYGYPMVCRHLLQDYHFEKLFSRIGKKHHLKFDIFEALLLMVCDRFNDPLSKLGTHLCQEEYIGVKHIELQYLYRTLDKLSHYSNAIQRQIYETNKTLFDYELDVVFFDVTTFYFDSHVEQPNTLRHTGYSKDGKIGKTQIVFALLVDRCRNPVAYRIYAGGYFEGHTFEAALTTLRREYCIGKVIIVGDRGMLSKKNLALFNKQQVGSHYQFIVGERLKSMSKQARDYLVDLKNYTTVRWRAEDGEEIPLTYCTYRYLDRLVIGTYSEKRAHHDQYERERKLRKAEQMLAHPAEIHKKAGRYFLKRTSKTTYELDKQRIEEAARYDGFLAIATNVTELRPEEVIERYKDLYKIESSFRTFKTYLETRPMFHWTDTRIQGHLCMCYISYCLLNWLQQQLKANSTPLSENTIRRSLSKMQLSKIVQNGNTLYLRSALDDVAIKLLKCLKLHLLPDMCTPQRLEDFF
jgi:transposase